MAIEFQDDVEAGVGDDPVTDAPLPHRRGRDARAATTPRAALGAFGALAHYDATDLAGMGHPPGGPPSGPTPR